MLGASGSGKTTLLRLIAGLDEPSAGTVLIDGASPHEARVAKRIGFVPQSPALLPWRTVARNARLLLEVNRDASGAPTRSTDELLGAVGLAEFAGAYPHELSGGMRQRVALVRAMALGAPLLLMDEPFAALDEITRADMRHLLAGLCEQMATTVVFVTHSVSEAVYLSDRVVVLSTRPGRIVGGRADRAGPAAPRRARGRGRRSSPSRSGCATLLQRGRRRGERCSPRHPPVGLAEPARRARRHRRHRRAVGAAGARRSTCRSSSFRRRRRSSPRSPTTRASTSTPPLVTARHAYLGMLIALVVRPCSFGSLLATSRFLEQAAQPLLVLILVAPWVAYFTSIVAWLGRGDPPVLFLVSLVAMPAFVFATVSGLRSADADARELLASVHASPLEVLWRLRLPSALPGVARHGPLRGRHLARRGLLRRGRQPVGEGAGLDRQARRSGRQRPVAVVVGVRHRGARRARPARRHASSSGCCCAGTCRSVGGRGPTPAQRPAAPADPATPARRVGPARRRSVRRQPVLSRVHDHNRSGPAPLAPPPDRRALATHPTALAHRREPHRRSRLRMRQRPPHSTARRTTPSPAAPRCRRGVRRRRPGHRRHGQRRLDRTHRRRPTRRATVVAGKPFPDDRCAANHDAGTISYLTGFDFAAAASMIDVFVAEQRGYYDDLCLDVEMTPSFSTANYPVVAAGRAQFASAGSFTEMATFAVANDADLVALVVEGRSPADVLILKPDTATTLDRPRAATPSASRARSRPASRRCSPAPGLVEGQRLPDRPARRLRPGGPDRPRRDRRLPRLPQQRTGHARARRHPVRGVRPDRRRRARFVRGHLHHPLVRRGPSDARCRTSCGRRCAGSTRRSPTRTPRRRPRST